jgi:class 3 adenylate cyclase/tetratricopeptide (TPR) repeat protein
MTCTSCGADNPSGAKFCNECGASLLRTCPSCTSPNAPGARFCSECGTALGEEIDGEGVAERATTAVAERRVVSVLFVDLVGFTAASEARDAEETRELLTRYFEIARTTIARYGGTVEKFIGDAVMAVWGAPVAKEDDAERAVRAALELAATVSALDPSLRARAGVLTGEAAVTVGAEGQGMVAGDLVNTASRIQSVAEPGSVLVGESTKRASEAAIAYQDAGQHELKGKTEPLQLWRAIRVVAGARGALRSAGLEGPFVGRDRELRLVKELYHGSEDEKRPQLVLVTGIAGIGKSRLAWEFEKYLDGLVGEAFWHRGRCLSYGEGVAYWALAEIVRMRCGIVEDEEHESALEKLRLALEEYILDADERAWVEPRLAHLLGLEEGLTGDQENLFSAWRILFERLAEQSPTVLVFEDLQWADEGLLDFIEYLLDWARGHPLFVLALARPEFAEKRPSWGAGKRSFSSLYLEPLPPEAMNDLLAGLVPGLPADLRVRILERAVGVPLYAVETVRMLLDRALLTREGDIYRGMGAIEDLEVPETLQALVAARLDALSTQERRLVECGAVLGKTFTKQGLAAVSGLAESDLDPLLASLLGKEILAVQADPRSPERGQYSFLQDIVKLIAYETISRRERKTKHIAAAEFLASVWSAEEHEIAEVLAAHYLDAYRAAPGDADAADLRAKAFETLLRAGERAASLGANAEAQHAFERARELTDDGLTQAELHERAGVMAYMGARVDEAAAHFERSIEIFENAGGTHPAARVAARLAEISWDRGRLEQGLERMDHAFTVLSTEEPDADLAALAAQIGRFRFFAGERERALERVEYALQAAEHLLLPETISQAVNTKGIVFISRGRATEGLALIRLALDVALEHDKPSAALRAYYNLADTSGQFDRPHESAALLREGLSLAHRVGNRYWEWSFLGFSYPLFVLGEWDEVLAREQGLPREDWRQARIAFASLLTPIIPVLVHRGEVEEAEARVQRFAELEASADQQEQGQVHFSKATLLLAEERYQEALRNAEIALETRRANGISYEAVKESWVVAVEAALRLDDLPRAEELFAIVETLPPGRLPQFLRAHSLRFRGRLASSRDTAEAEQLFTSAAELFRQLDYTFYLAVTLLEQAEWLTTQNRGGEGVALLEEAGEIFQRLQAKPWLERLAKALPPGTKARTVGAPS